MPYNRTKTSTLSLESDLRTNIYKKLILQSPCPPAAVAASRSAATSSFLEMDTRRLLNSIRVSNPNPFSLYVRGY